MQDNVLYVSAEEFDITGGNYSIVDMDTPKIANNRISMDGNYSTIKLYEHLERNCSHPANSELGKTKGKQKPTIKPKPKSCCINSEENRPSYENIKHITPNGSKGEGTRQPDQTYDVVDKARKRKYNPDETNKKKFVINYGNS